MKAYRIRTTDGQWYIHRLHGSQFVSFVSSKDRYYAESFGENVGEWVALFGGMVVGELEFVETGSDFIAADGEG